MAQITYTFSNAKDFPLGIFPALLIGQIEASPAISPTCKKVINKKDSDVVSISFSAELSLVEQTALAALIAAHTAAFVTGTNPSISREAHNGTPTVQDDYANGYPVLSKWFDISSRNAYVSVADDANNAAWDLLNPKTFYFEAFDLAGGITLNSGYTALNWDTEVLKDGIYQHSPDSSIVQINAKGWFEIRVELSTDIYSSSTRSTSMARIAVNAGQGFQALPGSKTYFYNRTSDAGFGSGSITRKVYCSTSGNQIRIEATKLSGSGNIETVPESCRLSIHNIKPLEPI